MELVRLGNTNFSHLKYDSDLKNDLINSPLLQDLQKAGQATDIVLTITTAKSDHNYNVKGTKRKSRHMDQVAVDISKLDGKGSNGATPSNLGSPEFREKGNKVKDALVAMGYTWNREKGNPKAVLWLTTAGGNHYNHLHVSNKSGAESDLDIEDLEITSNKSQTDEPTDSPDKEVEKKDKKFDAFAGLSSKEKDELFKDVMGFIASESKKGNKEKIISETLRIRSLMK